jgi:hypothetical protein
MGRGSKGVPSGYLTPRPLTRRFPATSFPPQKEPRRARIFDWGPSLALTPSPFLPRLRARRGEWGQKERIPFLVDGQRTRHCRCPPLCDGAFQLPRDPVPLPAANDLLVQCVLQRIQLIRVTTFNELAATWIGVHGPRAVRGKVQIECIAWAGRGRILTQPTGPEPRTQLP